MLQPLSPNNLLQADQARVLWRIFAPSGVSIEEICKDSYWAHVANRLHLYDEVEVIAEDGVYVAMLLVINCGSGEQDKIIQVQKIWDVKLQNVEQVGENLPDGYEIVWFGPKIRYGVVQKETKVRVSQNHTTKDDAAAWIRNNIKA